MHFRIWMAAAFLSFIACSTNAQKITIGTFNIPHLLAVNCFVMKIWSITDLPRGVLKPLLDELFAYGNFTLANTSVNKPEVANV